jgi:hypothetical protein
MEGKASGNQLAVLAAVLAAVEALGCPLAGGEADEADGAGANACGAYWHLMAFFSVCWHCQQVI